MTRTDATLSENRPRLTVELFLYALIFGLAVAVRLGLLGRWPLLDNEASLALAAWRFSRGVPTMLRGHSPLLFHANTLLFFLTGGSDAVARLVSLLFGSLLALLPHSLRPYLGRVGALVTSLMLALSPSFVYFSLALDGSVVVAFCALALLVVTDRLMREPQPIYATTTAVLLALAVLAGPSVYSLFAMLLTFPLFMRLWAKLRRDEALLDDLRHAWDKITEDVASWRKGLLIVAVLMLAAGLAFGYNPGGLQMTLDQFGQWVGGFHLLSGSPWYRAPLLLLVYECVPLCLGIAGLVLARERRGLLTVLLRYWFAFAILFTILPGYRPPNSVLLILVPLVLTAGQAAEHLWRRLKQGPRHLLLWALGALSLGVAAAAYVQVVTYLSLPASQYLMRLAALSVFVVSAYAFVWSLLGPEVPLHAASVSLVLLLLFSWTRSGVRLNYRRARDAAEPMVVAATSPDVLRLARKAAELSSELRGDERTMTWQLDKGLEVPLAWYLRPFEQLTYMATLPARPGADGVIVPAGTSAPGEYVGLRYALRSIETGELPSLFEWLRWWTGQESDLGGQAREEAVVLWARQPPQ